MQDEYANNVDNGGFTMASISTVLTYANMFRELFGKERNATYDVQADNVLIPKDPTTGISLEYTGELTLLYHNSPKTLPDKVLHPTFYLSTLQ